MRYGNTNKYGAVKTVIDGITFDSRHEAEAWSVLKIMEKAGAIRDLERQVKYELVPKTDKFRAVSYIADFRYYDCEIGETVVLDAKGVKTKEYLLKKKLMYWRYGIEVKEV